MQDVSQEIFSGLSPAQRLQVARHLRLSTLDYVREMTDEWMALRGDRSGFDDLVLYLIRFDYPFYG